MIAEDDGPEMLTGDTIDRFVGKLRALDNPTCSHCLAPLSGRALVGDDTLDMHEVVPLAIQPLDCSFTCDMCGQTFPKAWSDEEARAEHVGMFGVQPEDVNAGIVCDDCYQQVIAYLRGGQRT